MSKARKPWIVGITGASGVVYGVELCRELLRQRIPVHLIVTDAGWRVLKDELGWETSDRTAELRQQLDPAEGLLTLHPVRDVGASVASGSFLTAGMVIVPCSMGTLSAVARGASDNLLERAADVVLKEGRPLLLVPRETPLHAIHLENMLILARSGVKIIPAMPGFYHQPRNLEDIVRFLVGKILDMMDVEHDMYTRWGASTNESISDTDRPD